MNWLASAVSNITEFVEQSKEEFLAEQAKYCTDERTPPAQPASTPPASVAAPPHAVLRDMVHDPTWLKERADKLKHVGLAMLNPLGDDESHRNPAGAVDEPRLPWERADISAETAAAMRALSKDHMAFLSMPSEDTLFRFDLSATMPVILRLLQIDPQIERWRFLLVPKRMSEDDFFQNYFHQLAILAGDIAPPRPPTPGSPDSLAGVLAAAEGSAPGAQTPGLLDRRSATPSADSVGGSVVSVLAPSVCESEQFELISNEVLESIGRSQLSRCADAVITQPTIGEEASRPAPAAAVASLATESETAAAVGGSEVDSWEDELQAELARIEAVR